jgi:RHS repeat-associated protein
MDQNDDSYRRSASLKQRETLLLFEIFILLFLVVGFSPSDGFAQIEVFDYEYDTGLNGLTRLHSVTEKRGSTTVGSTTFSYDVRGNVTQTDKIIEGNPTPYTTKSTYDSMNRLVDLTYPDDEKLRHSYNTQGFLDSVVSLTSGTNYVSFDYNAIGQVTSKRLGNNRTTTYTYHPQNFRLTDLVTPGLQAFRYKYDGVGNIEEITDLRDPATPKIQSFGYDSLHRLTSASSTSSPSYNHTYLYNTIGNMKSFTTQSASGPIQTDFRYPFPYSDSRYPHAVQGDGTSNYGYDANGNMITKVTGSTNTVRNFIWDSQNRLIKVEENGIPLAEFTYDHTGRRVTKKTANQVTLYVDNRYECVSSGTNFTPAASTCTKYIFAGNQRVASLPAGSDPMPIHYYYGDHLGSTSMVTSFSEGNPETLVKELTYYPYGSLRVNIPPDTEIAYKYNDKELDEEIGLYYYGARYYDPALMRFISPDTIDPDRNYPQILNRYSYTLNNPLKYVDPDGHCAVLAEYSRIDCFTLTLQYHNAVVASAVSSFQQGNYLSATKNSLFSLGTALNVLAGLTLQGIVQPYNSTFMTTSGLMEGNTEKFIYGSLETVLIFGGMKLLNPSPVTINTANAVVASEAGGILGPSGPGQFILRSEASVFETATVVRRGEFLNRVFDSRFVSGADVSGPLGRSFAPGSGVPTTASEAILQRGLNIFYPNNAQEAIIYRATGNIPGTLRMSIGGTTPEILINPSFYGSLEPITQYPLIP